MMNTDCLFLVNLLNCKFSYTEVHCVVVMLNRYN